jgi:hypothetical protein
VNARTFPGTFPAMSATMILALAACTDARSPEPLAPPMEPAAGSHDGSGFGAGLVGWWRFDDAAADPAVTDESGLGNHGVLVADAAYSPEALLGMAVDITGPSGHVSVPHDPSLEPATGTFQAWVKVAALKDADVASKSTLCMVRTEDCSEPIGRSVIGLRIMETGGVAAFIANNDPATSAGPWTFATVAADAITTGTWHHLAMRWDGAELALFVDGALRAAVVYDPVPGTGLSYFNGTALRLGAATSWGAGHPGDREFIGQIDEVRFYGRARADVEIFTDYITSGHKPAAP